MTEKPDLEQVILANMVDRRLNCAVAHQIAEQYGWTLPEIGKMAETLKIKISKCQLGCF
ncbi:MAG: hypothetical protein AB9895_02150 [Negativicutes bacterium]